MRLIHHDHPILTLEMNIITNSRLLYLYLLKLPTISAGLSSSSGRMQPIILNIAICVMTEEEGEGYNHKTYLPAASHSLQSDSSTRIISIKAIPTIKQTPDSRHKS